MSLILRKAQIRRNIPQNGIEIIFEPGYTIPDKDKSYLSEQSFRWNGYKKLYWRKYNIDTWENVNNYFSNLPSESNIKNQSQTVKMEAHKRITADEFVFLDITRSIKPFARNEYFKKFIPGKVLSIKNSLIKKRLIGKNGAIVKAGKELMKKIEPNAVAQHYIMGYDKIIKKYWPENKDENNINKTQLELGTAIEMEHTKDKSVAEKIAMDHLKENPNYYTDPKPKNWAEKELEKENKPITEAQKEASKPNIIEKIRETWDSHLKTVGEVRPDFMNQNILKGREIQISMPNGEKRNAQFAIVELDNVIASHDEETFHSSRLYPKNSAGNNINDRNYKDDTAAQKAVMDYARELEPERLITTSRTPSGTPIVTKDGFVVSGNNRTMSLKLAAKSYPENYKEYVKFLAEEIEAYGFAKEWGDKLLKGERIEFRPSHIKEVTIDFAFPHPVLVRIDYDFPEYTTQELAKYNKDTKKSERPIDKAIKLSNILIENPRCSDIIAETVGEYETFSEFYANMVSQKRLAKNLLECNLLTDQEMPAYFSDTTFTETGKEFIENLLASLILNRDALLASEQPGVKSIRGKLITALPVLMKNASLPEGNLKKYFNDAVIFQQKMVASGLSFVDFIRQRNMFGETYDRKTVYVNRLIDSGKIKFKQAIEGYNTAILRNQGATMFGDKPTIDEIFNHWIVGNIDETDKKLIKSSDVVSKGEEEQPDNSTSKFLDNLHELDLWVEHNGRHYRKFILNPETARNVTDLGIKERMMDIIKGGKNYIEAIISIPSINDSLENEIEKAYQENTKTASIVSEEITTPTQTDEELQDIDPNYDAEKGRKYLKVWKDHQNIVMSGFLDKLVINRGEGSDNMKLFAYNNLGLAVGEIDMNRNMEVNNHRGQDWKDLLQKVADRIRMLADNPRVQIVGMPKVESKQEPYNKIELLRNTKFIKTGETRIDDAYDTSDPEYNQEKVFIPTYQTKWWISQTESMDPDTESFDNIDEALKYAKGQGKSEPLANESPVHELWLTMTLAWIDRNNDIVESENKPINYEEFIYDNKDLEFVKKFGEDGLIESFSYDSREQSANELLNKIEDNIHENIPSVREINGKQYKISIPKYGKYRDIQVNDINGKEIDTITLRISDHAYNPKNNDIAQKEGRFISIEIANKNETQGRFGGAYSLQFTGEDTESEIYNQVNKKIDEIIKKILNSKTIDPEPMKSDILDIFLPKIKIIKPFISQPQLDALINMYRSEEKQAAIDIATQLAETISTMPATYETENIKENDKIIHLHYFRGGSDWYIIEKDKGAKDDPVPGIQYQAFGYTVLNGDDINAEWGYISIEELIRNNVELDFYWNKKTFGELKKKWEQRAYNKEYEQDKQVFGYSFEFKPVNKEGKALREALADRGVEWINLPEDGEGINVAAINYKGVKFGFFDNSGEFKVDAPNEYIGQIDFKDETGKVKPISQLADELVKIFEEYKPETKREAEKITAGYFNFTSYNTQPLRTQDGFNILLVDGEAVRKDHIEFTMGGNGYAYDWIPKDEIWIDENLSEKTEDMEATIKHEIFEAKKMRDEGLSYEEAHNLANEMEKKERQEMYETFYTNAPESYDGFGTKTVGKTDYVDYKGNPVRKIEIAKKNIDWQKQRNSSGNNSTLNEIEWEELKDTIFKKAEPIQSTLGTKPKLNPYIAMYKGKKHELYAETKLKARDQAAEFFKVPAKDAYKVDVYFAQETAGDVAKRQIAEDVKPEPKFKILKTSETSRDWGKDIEQDLKRGFNVYKSYFRYKGDSEWKQAYLLSSPDLTENKALESARRQFGSDMFTLSEMKELNNYEFKVEKAEPQSAESIETEVKAQPEPITAKNQKHKAYLINKEAEALLDRKWNDAPDSFTSEELELLRQYSGAGGLDEYFMEAGEKLHEGSLYEFYTPDLVIQKMWGLAYKYGYNNGPVLEPSIGVGRFFNRKFVKDYIVKEAYEPNKYSARICKILYPEIQINDGKESMFFEEVFIKNNWTVKSNVKPKYSLVIGNPPYGEAMGKYLAGMGEKAYTHAKNFIDYFIFRGLDLLEPGGLLIYIIGAEVGAGGVPWLDQQNSKCKEAIAQKANLIDAYRLPEKVFDRTDVVSDIIVFRKK
jgi:hypothetical protein